MNRRENQPKPRPNKPPNARVKRRGWRGRVRTKDTVARLEKCLDLLKFHGVINVACRQSIVAGRALSKETLYRMRQEHADFADEMDAAISQSVKELEASGMACARMAQKDPRYLPMLKFALQVKGGWKSAERLEHTGKDGGPIRQRHDFDPATMTDDQLRRIIEQDEESAG